MQTSKMNDAQKLRSRIPLSPGVIAANPRLFGPQSPTVTAAISAAIEKTKKPRRAVEMNQTEREYLAMLTRSFPDAIIKWEAYTLRLASRATYTPDFSVLHPSGQLDFYEVKGAYIFPKALVKPRIAAVQFPQHAFTLAQKLKSGWEITLLANK